MMKNKKNPDRPTNLKLKVTLIFTSGPPVKRTFESPQQRDAFIKKYEKKASFVRSVKW
jgi:hypothetical protein